MKAIFNAGLVGLALVSWAGCGESVSDVPAPAEPTGDTTSPTHPENAGGDAVEKGAEATAESCEAASCGAHGYCVTSVDGAHCLCDAGFAGERCDACAPGFAPVPGADECAQLLSSARNEAAGANCELGGVASESGIDLDGDGVLDVGEVTSAQYVCNVATPACVGERCSCEPDTCGGLGACVETDRGATCLCDGGYAGRDCELCADGFVRAHDGDACIRPRELTSTQTVAPGDRCAEGGVAEQRGHDLDDDGALSANEVESTDYLCHQPHVRAGDVNVKNQAELDDLVGVTEITGNLVINSPYIETLDPIAGLARVRGNVWILGNGRLTSAEALESLREVHGNVSISDNPRLRALAFANLSRVSGSLHIEGNESLATIDLGSLETVGGALSVTRSPALEAIVGDGGLLSVKLGLSLSEAPALDDIGALTGLDAVGAALVISSTGLTALDALSNLTDCGGLSLRSNLRLTNIEGLSALRSVRGDFVVAENAALTTLGAFPVLHHVNGHLGLSGLVLARIDGFRALEQAAALSISDSPLLAEVRGFSALERIGPAPGCVSWQDNCISGGLWLSNLPALAALHAFEVLEDAGQSLYLSSLPALHEVHGLQKVARAGSVSVADTGLVRFTLDALGETTSLWFARNAELVALGDFALLTTASSLDVYENPSLLELPTMPLLEHLPQGLRVAGNTALTGTVGLSALTAAGTYWENDRSPFYFTLPALPNSESGGWVQGGVQVHDNAALVSLGFLGRLIDSSLVVIARNGALREAHFTANPLGTAALYLLENPVLARAKVDAAANVGALYIDGNPQLSTLEGMPSQAEMDSLTVIRSPALTDLRGLEQVTRIWRLRVQANATFQSFAGYTGAVSSLDVLDNPALASCAVDAFAQATGAWVNASHGNDDTGVCP